MTGPGRFGLGDGLPSVVLVEFGEPWFPNTGHELEFERGALLFDPLDGRPGLEATSISALGSSQGLQGPPGRREPGEMPMARIRGPRGADRDHGRGEIGRARLEKQAAGFLAAECSSEFLGPEIAGMWRGPPWMQRRT